MAERPLPAQSTREVIRHAMAAMEAEQYGEAWLALKSLLDPEPAAKGPCGRIMVGSGTDTYDPICELISGHRGSCKSTTAIDQHRLAS